MSIWNYDNIIKPKNQEKKKTKIIQEHFKHG